MTEVAEPGEGIFLRDEVWGRSVRKKEG